MKVIDLLNRIANNEEVPKKINVYRDNIVEVYTYVWEKGTNGKYDYILEDNEYYDTLYFRTEELLTTEIEVVE